MNDEHHIGDEGSKTSADQQGQTAYHVGYGKPPKTNQFKKGQSGNPRGRKKADTTIRSIMRKISAEKITVQSPDGPKGISATEMVLLNLRNRAAKGDNRATSQFLGLLLSVFGIGEPETTKTDISAEDRALLREALKSMNGETDGEH